MQEESVQRFYDGLAGEYHLMYADWRQEVRRQSSLLDGFIRQNMASPAKQVLDCTCGIGTQAIALALAGYRVHATDLSAAAVERALREAGSFEVTLTGEAADLRKL